MAKTKLPEGYRVVAENRKARHNYFIEDTVEAGLVLLGTEVKSLRLGKGNIAESYAAQDNGELFLINANIPEYFAGNRNNHAPTRPRKLLLHARELARLTAAIQRGGMTLVPLKLYFNDRGRAKVELGLGKGKKLHDKRQSDKDRGWKRDQARLMREKG